MKNAEILRGVRELIGEAHALSDEADRREAEGWLVVTVDDESGKVVHALGDFDSPEEALVYASKLYEDDKRTLGDSGEPGWTHSVVARFKPSPH